MASSLEGVRARLAAAVKQQQAAFDDLMICHEDQIDAALQGREIPSDHDIRHAYECAGQKVHALNTAVGRLGGRAIQNPIPVIKDKPTLDQARARHSAP